MRNFLFVFVVLACTFCTTFPRPPVAGIVPDTLVVHDTVLIDNYSWLKDKTRSNPKVLQYIEAENHYTEQILKKNKKLETEIYQEMVARINKIDVSAPVKIDEYYYYTVYENDKQYPRYCRRKGSPEAPEEIYLDLNKLAQGHRFYSVIGLKLSADHSMIAFGVDTTGNEIYDLKIMKTATGEFLQDTASEIDDICWANDNKTLFYTKQDAAGRSYQVFRHHLGTDSTRDELIFQENDERFWAWVAKSRNDKFIEIGSDSKTTSELWLLSADQPNRKPEPFQLRQDGIEFYTVYSRKYLFLITNQEAKNRKILYSPLENPFQPQWEIFLAPRDSVKVSALAFADFLVVTELHNNQKKIRIFNLEDNSSHYLDFPEEIYSCNVWSSTEFDSEVMRFGYESLTTPYSVYDYNMKTHQRNLIKQQEVAGGYNPDDYKSERLFAIADDGTQIPISLLYRKDIFRQDGSSPLYLTGYGAYGDSFDPYFSRSRLSLIDRGVSYAIAHIRGGGELGKDWYDQGKMLNKKNTFTDFIACSEFLINNKVTSSDRFIIDGGSAGGLLIGAVLNMRPDLYLGTIADVPFVDMLNTMLDPSLSAVVSEYEEWGNPNIKEQFDYMLSYSPYENIKHQNYPHILALAGFYDARVNYWEAAKWVAKLRAYKTDDNLVLLKTNMAAGHSGSSGRYDYLKEVALIYSFVFLILEQK